MEIYRGCNTEVFRFERRKSFDNAKTDVMIGEGRIRLTYRDDRGKTFEYEGDYHDRGTCELTCEQNNGRSTICWFPDRRILAGPWEEDWDGREHGFWSIEVPARPSARS